MSYDMDRLAKSLGATIEAVEILSEWVKKLEERIERLEADARAVPVHTKGRRRVRESKENPQEDHASKARPGEGRHDIVPLPDMPWLAYWPFGRT